MSEQQGPDRDTSEQSKRENSMTEDELEALRAELDEANRTGQEYLQLLQRVQADFNNFRRRAEQQKTEQASAVKSEMVLKILPVLDDFDRALEAMPENDKTSDWGQGIALIERKLRSVLDDEGVRRIEALGRQFDPWEMEAIDYVPVPGHAEGEVIDVTRDGYKLGERVVRPAQVRVASQAHG